MSRPPKQRQTAGGHTLAALHTRNERLRLLIEQCGGQTALASKLGYANPSYISQMLAGHSTIGDKAARSIERKLDLPGGWMDDDHRPAIAGGPVNTALFDQIARIAVTVVDKSRYSLSAHQLATLVTLSYAEALKNKRVVDTDVISRLAKLAQRAASGLSGNTSKIPRHSRC